MVKKNISSFEKAICDGNIVDIRAHIDSGISPDAPLSSGQTPLFSVINSGNLEIVKVLVDAGADVERRNSKNQTALYAAAWEGKTEIVKKLLLANANPNAPCGPQGQTPLFAVMEGFDEHCFTDASSLRIITSLLLANKADYEYRLTTGVTTLHGVAICNDLGLLNLFLAKKPDINVMAGGASPIAISVRQGKAAMVSRFIEAGAKTDISFPNGVTLLDFAKQRGDKQILEALQNRYPQEKTSEVIPEMSLKQTITEVPPVPPKMDMSPKQVKGGSWDLVPMSGLIAGIAFAIARDKMANGGLLIAAVAYFICIHNKNFRYNWNQKIVAILIMLCIGFFGVQLLELFKQSHH